MLRSVVLALALFCGACAGFLLARDWAGAVFMLGAEPGLADRLDPGSVKLAWTISASVVVFAAVGRVGGLLVGLVEAFRARARMDALRREPVIDGRTLAADWNAAFAPTAIGCEAEAIAAPLFTSGKADWGGSKGNASAALFGLEAVWLDRLALTAVIGPLPPLLLALGVTLALAGEIVGASGWDAALAAGVAGWLAVALVAYLARLCLAPAVSLAVRASVAALRPPAGTALADEPPAERLDPDALAFAIERTVAEPLGRLADIAEQWNATAASARAEAFTVDGREAAIESALSEVRAGIEKLLSAQR